MISLNYPQLREIPRIILFDCCDGDYSRSHHTSNKSEQVAEKGKNFDVDDIPRIKSVWRRDEKNPDYKLGWYEMI